jgi:hypothetical protein
LYTQFKEKSFIAGLGTNGSSTFQYAIQATAIIPMAAKTLEQAGFEVRPF